MAKKKKHKPKLDVLVVAKQNKIGLKMAKRLEKILEDEIGEIRFDPSTAGKLKKFGRKGTAIDKFDGDLIITLGGDGTLLFTATHAKVPILPVRIEGYGFLCTAEFRDIVKNIDRIKKKDYTIIKRMRLKCTKIRKGKIEKYIERILHSSYPLSINEIVFARKRPSKILEIEFKIDNTSFSVSGDGLMIYTPSGSTAYSASSGGSLIDQQLDVIGIVPLYPFFSKLKPMIIPVDKKVEVKVKGGDCALIIDGHGGEYVRNGAEFLIEKGEPVRIITLSEFSFYEKFKEKFLS
ncbi:MAG: NAD(+)/NADH kinase [Candidatus Aenigmatarchaeota archaeon]